MTQRILGLFRKDRLLSGYETASEDLYAGVEEEDPLLYTGEETDVVQIDDVLDRRYQILEKICSNGGTIIWLARDLYIWIWAQDRYVSIKTILIRNAHERERRRQNPSTSLLLPILIHDSLATAMSRSLLTRFLLRCQPQNTSSS